MRRILVSCVVAAALTMVVTAQASAVTGTPVTVASAGSPADPSVAVGADGTALIAWATTATADAYTIGYCVIAPGSTTCAQHGTLQPAPTGAGYIDGVTAINDGGTLAILADVYGTGSTSSTANDSGQYIPVQEWQSADGGATFTAQASGKSVTDGILGADTEPLGAITIPGTGTLGYAWDTAAGPPTFQAFSLANPQPCSSVNAPSPCSSTQPFATLEPASNPDVVTNAGGNFATDATGVLGIYNTDFTSGPLGCSNAQTVPFGTAFVYGNGAESAANDYSLSPGTSGSAWKTAVTQADCNVDYPAVGGGPSGFGVLEDNELTKTTIYHRFDENVGTFQDIAPVTVSTTGEQEPTVSQDAGGAVYATYLSGGVGGPVTLAYSYDGGTTWTSAPLTANTAYGFGNLTSAVSGSGQGWAAWLDNGSVVVQQFNRGDAISPQAPTTLTTSQTAGATSGASISVPAGVVGETDTATIAGANAAKATGTIAYQLYSSASCAAASTVFHSGPAAVNGSSAPPSPAVTSVLMPGKYYWRATYSGNAGTDLGVLGNLPSSTACGSEVLTVTPPTTLSGTGTATADAVKVKVGCAIVPCTLKLALTATEKVAIGKKSSLAQATLKKGKKIRYKLETIGVAVDSAAHIRKKGDVAVDVKITKAGKKFFNARHGKVKLTLTVTEKIKGTALTSKRGVEIQIIKPKKKPKRG